MHESRDRWLGAGAVVLLAAAVAAAAWVALSVPSRAEPSSYRSHYREIVAGGQEDVVASLWIGDSYTAGTGAASPSEAESCLTADAMGWICSTDAQAGTGFVSDGHESSDDFQPLAGRLPATAQEYAADVVVIDAGRFDETNRPRLLVAAARTYLGHVREAYPDADLVLVAPYLMGHSGALRPSLVDLYRAEAQKPHTYLIDPNAEGWMSPSVTQGMTIPDGVHPNPAGHRYIAEHLAADLRRLGVSG